MSLTHQEVDLRGGKTKQAPADLKLRASQLSLCLSCAEAPSCLYRRGGYSVHYCDDYNTLAHMDPPDIPLPTESKGHRKPGEALGLCASCVHQSTCNFAISEKGVWHCSEFEEIWP